MSKKKEPLTLCWFIHHECILEPITYPLEDRINNIKYCKAASQRKSRLEAIKLVKYPKWLPRGILGVLDRAHRAGRTSSTAIMMEFWRRNPALLQKVRRRLFKEYPKCPVLHHHPEKSILAFSSAARTRARAANRKLFGK